MSTLWTFDGIENKHDAYICEDCMKKFCESLREHAKKIINFEKKKMIPLTNERQESYEKAKICNSSKQKFKDKYDNNNNNNNNNNDNNNKFSRFREHWHFTGK